MTAEGAVQLYKDVGAALPNTRLYGPDGACGSGFTNPAENGISSGLGARFKCTVATLNLASYPGGSTFLSAFRRSTAEQIPTRMPSNGYEAMKLGLDTIKRLGDKGNDKSDVLQALFSTKHRQSVLGPYSFDQNGDTTLTEYGVYMVGSDGNPTFESAITAG